MSAKYLSIGLVVLLLLPVVTKVWIMADFVIRQDYIADNYCINGGLPAAPMCSGKCYLVAQLQQASEQEQPGVVLGLVAKLEAVYVALPPQLPPTTGVDAASYHANFHPICVLPGRLVGGGVFHPPRA